MPVTRLGLILAVLLAGGFALAFRVFAAENRLTPPTRLLAETYAFEPLGTEVPPDAIFAATVPGDGRLLYQQAIDAVRREPSRYAALAESADAALIEQSPAVAALLAAASRGGEPLGAVDTRVGYDPQADDLDALLAAARAAGRAAQWLAPTDAARARTLYEAQFALGSKLFANRVRQSEATVGLTVAREAALGLRDLAAKSGDTRRAALLSTFERAASGLQDRRIAPVWDAVGSVDERVVAEHSGDVYALTDATVRERVWRVEAVLALGRHRFNLDRDADRLIVPRRLSDLAVNETDPAVLAAIRAAQGLTVEQYRTLH